jgi:DNA polymerase III epsilon subunit-like protein
MDFVALDFETANSHRGSPCEVALVRVRNGKVVDTYDTFLYQDSFDGFNMALHGITPDLVEEAPEIESEWPTIRSFIGDDPIVAHYAAFDTGVMRDSLGLGAFESPITYFCSVVLSRQLLNLPSYRLPWVADALGVEFEETHRSLADAIAVAEIVLTLLSRSNSSSLLELAESIDVRPGLISSTGWKGSVHKSQYAGRLTASQRAEILESIPVSELYEDPDFVGKDVVFTGTLESMTRQEAQLRVMKAGGIPKTSVSKRTNLLVFGQQDSYSLRPGAKYSNKMSKAMELIELGANLEVVDEETFLQMINSPEGVES